MVSSTALELLREIGILPIRNSSDRICNLVRWIKHVVDALSNGVSSNYLAQLRANGTQQICGNLRRICNRVNPRRILANVGMVLRHNDMGYRLVIHTLVFRDIPCTCHTPLVDQMEDGKGAYGEEAHGEGTYAVATEGTHAVEYLKKAHLMAFEKFCVMRKLEGAHVVAKFEAIHVMVEVNGPHVKVELIALEWTSFGCNYASMAI